MTSLLDREFSPPRTLKEEADRWLSKLDGSGSERWRSNDDDDHVVNDERWTRRSEMDRRDNVGTAHSRDRSPRDRRFARERGNQSNYNQSHQHREQISSLDNDGRRNSIRNDRMVYVANIPYNVRWMELKDIVREKAGEVNFVELLEDRSGKSKGAAVIEFREKESVQRCLETLHRYPMNDRLLTAKEIRDPVAFFRKVKDDTGVDFLNGLHGGTALPSNDTRSRQEEQFETFGLSPAFLRQLKIAGPLTNRVFISNLPYNVQSGRIHDYFSLAGKVTWVDLQLDKEGRSKGMAVVQFTHPIEAVQAISMLNNQRVFDRQINVKMDKFDPVDDRKEGELPIGLRSVGMGLGANGAPLGDVSSVISTLGSSASHGSFEPPSAPYISNQSNFQTNSISALSSVVPFSSPYAVSSGGTMPVPNSGGYTTSGYSAFGNSVNAGYGTSRSIIIKNLPLDYTWQIVRDRVQQFGPVELTEMIAPGCAKVTFTMAADADRARKALLNTTVEGRLIGVEFLA